MQIEITARHGQLDNDARLRMQQKVEKLVRLFDRLTSVHVTADLALSESPEVEIRVSAEHHEDFVATESKSNIGAAFDGAIHKLEAQLRKHKDKRYGRRATGAKHIESPELNAEDEEL